jgi:hypothetical protein
MLMAIMFDGCRYLVANATEARGEMRGVASEMSSIHTFVEIDSGWVEANRGISMMTHIFWQSLVRLLELSIEMKFADVSKGVLIL